MHSRLQFGMRENPASDRRHGSRHGIETKSDSNYSAEGSQEALATTALAKLAFADADAFVHAAPNGAATGRKSTRLLTVYEVAELLRVPASWVYGRTRKRSLQRLPGYRLGKYWRFREDEIHAWVKSQGGGCNA